MARFKSSLTSSNLVTPGDAILAAVSGGLDSVALLHLLAGVQPDLNLTLQVIHVHHGLRGKEADRDLEFTRTLAQKLNFPFHVRKVAAKEFARVHQLSLEESARQLRYQAFDEVLAETRSTKLATAHTADDQAETVLDHFLRGSGIRGLRGMTASRGRYIRPLLEFTRLELEQFVREHQLPYCEDSSNRDLNFKRNRIRHELIPYLKKYFNPEVTDALTKTARILDESEAFLTDFAGRAYKSLVSLQKKSEIVLEIEPFLNYFSIVQKYILFHAGEQLGVARCDWTFEKIERILKAAASRRIGKKILINREFETYIDHDGLVIRKRPAPDLKLKVDLMKQSFVDFGRFQIRWSILNKEEGFRFDKNKNVEFVDFDKTGHLVYLRTCVPGDRFIPLNFSGHKKLASYFSDHKAPHHLRRETPILESSAGIVWIGGFGIDDRFKVTNQTRNLLKLELIDKSDAP